MTDWALDGFCQRLGSSASAFSSDRRVSAISTSKMPPQQLQGLLDFGKEGLNFSAHGKSGSDGWTM
jgi:hypothetical protein